VPTDTGIVAKRRLPVLPPDSGQPSVPNDDWLGQAMSLAVHPTVASLPRLRATTRRTLSRRGIVWLGQTCNLHCQFCYFIDRVTSKDHPEHSFMPLDKAKTICQTLRDVYRNSSIDIEGGEPTLYPKILELIEYCVRIGLYPTLITNGLVLDRIERCRAYRDAGIRDFKISIHGLGPVHDWLVQRDGAHVRQMRALRNLQEVGIPFRFNVVLTPYIVSQLPDIARLAAATGALCVNWLGFNPHEDQSDKAGRFALIPSFDEMRGPLNAALDVLVDAGIESNVRYVPHCMVDERHRSSVYHFQQLFYDHREWDWASWAWTTLPAQRRAVGATSEPVRPSSLWWWFRLTWPIRFLSGIPGFGRLLSAKRWVNHPAAARLLFAFQRLVPEGRVDRFEKRRAKVYDGVARLHARVNCDSVQPPPCSRCAARSVCSGLYRDYVRTFGTQAVQPIAGPTITDPLHFIRKQSKLVEREDEAWA
jgi:pyruvate-formate lyase-activating enzyme